MKQNVHPVYYPSATVRCACGNTFAMGATKEAIDVEICSHCHPFYTGQQKVIDAAGRVERYRRIVAETTARRENAAARSGAAEEGARRATEDADISERNVSRRRSEATEDAERRAVAKPVRPLPEANPSSQTDKRNEKKSTHSGKGKVQNSDSK